MGHRVLRFVWDLIKIPVCAYLILAGSFFVFQRQLEYFPDNREFNLMEFGVEQPFEVIVVELSDGLRIRSWYYPPRDQKKPVVVFTHGNSGYLALRAFRIQPLLNTGYGLVLVGYPGFDGNPGAPNETGIIESARGVVNNLLGRGYSLAQIVLHGESLGTTVAVRLASEFKVAAVSLEAPPTSMADVMFSQYPLFPMSLLLRDKYDSLRYMSDVQSPLLIIHGEADTVVPIAQAKTLFSAARVPKEVLYISNVGHGRELYTENSERKLMEFYARFSP